MMADLSALACHHERVAVTVSHPDAQRRSVMVGPFSPSAADDGAIVILQPVAFQRAHRPMAIPRGPYSCGSGPGRRRASSWSGALKAACVTVNASRRSGAPAKVVEGHLAGLSAPRRGHCAAQQRLKPRSEAAGSIGCAPGGRPGELGGGARVARASEAAARQPGAPTRSASSASAGVGQRVSMSPPRLALAGHPPPARGTAITNLDSRTAPPPPLPPRGRRHRPAR